MNVSMAMKHEVHEVQALFSLHTKAPGMFHPMILSTIKQFIHEMEDTGKFDEKQMQEDNNIQSSLWWNKNYKNLEQISE